MAQNRVMQARMLRVVLIIVFCKSASIDPFRSPRFVPPRGGIPVVAVGAHRVTPAMRNPLLPAASECFIECFNGCLGRLNPAIQSLRFHRVFITPPTLFWVSLTISYASKLGDDPDGSIEFSPRQHIGQIRLQHVGLCLVNLGARFSSL